MVTDKKGKIFDDRRTNKDRRTDSIKVKENKRVKTRRSEDKKMQERRQKERRQTDRRKQDRRKDGSN